MNVANVSSAGTVTAWLQKLFARRTHKPIDLWIGLAATATTVLLAYVANGAGIPQWEISLFRAINNLPDWLFFIIWPFMQYGVFVTIPIASTIAVFFKKYRLAIMMLAGGIGIYFGARVLKSAVARGRPGDLLDMVQAREKFAPLSKGFTSGHTAVAGAIATFAHAYLPKKWQIASIFTLIVVLFGRIYIGAHLPIDVFGGVALGVAVASLLNYIVGVPNQVGTTQLQKRKVAATYHRPRHPGDIVRFVVAGMVFVTLTVLAFGGDMSLIEQYLFRLINVLPAFLSPVLQFLMQAGALYFVPIAAGIALAFKHRRLAVKLLLGGTTVWWFARLAKTLVNRDRPFYLLEGIVQRATNSGLLGFPSGHAAVAALIATVSAPYLKKNWARTIWIIAWTVAIARVYVGAHLPLDVFAGMAMGWGVGSLLNLAFGTPPIPLPLKAIRRTLREADLEVEELGEAEVDARGSAPFFAKTKKGKSLFIKIVDNEHRNADILFKAWRYFTRREVEDEAPFATAKQLVEHEAYLASQAASSGVRTPPVLLAAPVAPHVAMFSTEKIRGHVLSKYTGGLDRNLLSRVWGEVKKLHEKRIAHRDLRAANIIIDRHKQPWIIDFSFAETAASDSRLTMDIVELLTSLSMITTPKQAVKSAIAVLGKVRVQEAIPYLQPLALSSVTRKLAHSNPELLQSLRNEAAIQTGSSMQGRVRLTRFNYNVFFWLIVAALVFYFFLPRIGELDDSLLALRSIDVAWVPMVLLASFATYVASAFVVMGSTDRPLPFGRTFLVSVATSFVNRITPKSVGGFALTERYLEKSGLKRTEALAAVSLTYFSGIVIHVALLIITAFVVNPRLVDWSSIPQSGLILIIIVAALVVGGLLFIPRTKRQIRRYIREGWLGLRRGFTQPIKFMQLMGGSAALTLLYAVALYASLEGFGATVSFGTVLLVYLAGSAIAAASPTPGGLGATEAALAAGLTLLDVPTGQAVTGVLAFRLFTFWLPTLPGFLAFRFFKNRQII